VAGVLNSYENHLIVVTGPVVWVLYNLWLKYPSKEIDVLEITEVDVREIKGKACRTG
jgi:hypothetical protein